MAHPGGWGTVMTGLLVVALLAVREAVQACVGLAVVLAVRVVELAAGNA